MRRGAPQLRSSRRLSSTRDRARALRGCGAPGPSRRCCGKARQRRRRGAACHGKGRNRRSPGAEGAPHALTPGAWHGPKCVSNAPGGADALGHCTCVALCRCRREGAASPQHRERGEPAAPPEGNPDIDWILAPPQNGDAHLSHTLLLPLLETSLPPALARCAPATIAVLCRFPARDAMPAGPKRFRSLDSRPILRSHSALPLCERAAFSSSLPL